MRDDEGVRDETQVKQHGAPPPPPPPPRRPLFRGPERPLSAGAVAKREGTMGKRNARALEEPRQRVLLVQPPSTHRNFLYQTISSPPLGLCSLASFLIKHGVDARIVDIDFSSTGAYRRILRDFRPSIVGFTSAAANFGRVRELASLAKKAGARCVLGGPYPATSPLEAMRASGIGAVVLGDGEPALLALCRTGDWGKVKGLALMSGGRMRLTPPAARVSDLDALGFPDRRLIDASAYSETDDYGRKVTRIMASRGCPYSCSFCQNPVVMGPRWRHRSVGNVIEELRDVLSLGYTYVWMMDYIFGLDVKWLAEFADRMEESGLSRRIAWSCQRRVDLTDGRTLALLKRAGCTDVSFGVESGSERILKLMSKGITPERARRAVSLAKRSGFRVTISVMIGYPGETAQDLEETRRFLMESEADTVSILLFVPFEGTAAHGQAKAAGMDVSSTGPVRGWSNDRVIRGNGILSAKELEDFRLGTYKRFYARPARLARRVLELARTPRLLLPKMRRFLELAAAGRKKG